VAQASGREVIVVDAAKCSERLGTHHPIPVEVVDFGWRPEAVYLESLGATVTQRKTSDGSVFRTDQHNVILDADFGPIDDPKMLTATLLARAGIVEVGLFCGLASDLVVGTPNGVEHRPRGLPTTRSVSTP
jgi:ribose 5-phosphate isomerase A